MAEKAFRHFSVALDFDDSPAVPRKEALDAAFRRADAGVACVVAKYHGESRRERDEACVAARFPAAFADKAAAEIKALDGVAGVAELSPRLRHAPSLRK